MTDAAGAVVQTRQYDAWGNLEAGADEPGYAFTGREWDPEIGLYYYRARYYDPKVGRFISEDPIGFAGDLNFYFYVDDGPTGLVDPFGLAGIRSDIMDRWVWSMYGPPPTDPAQLAAWKAKVAIGVDLSLLPMGGVAVEAPGAAAAGAARACKAVNLPAWKRVAIDMEEVLSGHTKDGYRAIQSGIKDLFPEGMSAEAIERAIRQAYRYGRRLSTQGERVLVEGVTNAGMRIRMWVNRLTKTIETAWPK